MKEVKMAVFDGAEQTFMLPDLDGEGLHILGESLNHVRSLCVMSYRKFQGSNAAIGDRLKVGQVFAVLVGKLRYGRDAREEIINLDDALFSRFLSLMQDVAQDNGKVLDHMAVVLKGFGLAE